jgi:hypothetical protein
MRRCWPHTVNSELENHPMSSVRNCFSQHILRCCAQFIRSLRQTSPSDRVMKLVLRHPVPSRVWLVPLRMAAAPDTSNWYHLDRASQLIIPALVPSASMLHLHFIHAHGRGMWFVPISCLASEGVWLRCGPNHFILTHILKIVVFWDVAQCSVVQICRRFRGACCFHHQLWNVCTF